MGSSNLQPAITYKTIKREKHSVLGLIDFIEAGLPEGQKNFTVKTKSFLDLNEFQKFQEKIKKRMVIQDKNQSNIIVVHHCVEKPKIGYCSNIRELQFFYDEIQEDLQLEYLFKKCNRSVYSEEDILKIIKQSMRGIDQAEQKQLKLFHLSKKSILKRKNHVYCLVLQEDTQALHPIDEYVTNFHGEMFNKNYYLSPRQLQSINQHCILPEQNGKDHIFTLGMIVLSLCLMKEFLFESEIISVKIEHKQKQFIFEDSLIKIQLDKTRKLISQIRYSQKIKRIISRMIQYSQDKRLSIDDLNQILEQQEIHAVVEDIQLKKTSKKLKWHRKFQSSKENLQLIPPSLEQCQQHSIQPIRSKSTSKQIVNVFIDAKQLLNQRNAVIATEAKNYKRSKMSSLKIDNYCEKQAVSQVISQNIFKDIITPIKKLNDAGLAPENPLSRELFKGIKRCIKAQSTYECQSYKTILQNLQSRTSLAVNLLTSDGIHRNNQR